MWSCDMTDVRSKRKFFLQNFGTAKAVSGKDNGKRNAFLTKQS